jgi:hypothetical protein
MHASLLQRVILALTFALAGCIKPYQIPGPNEPHALLKLRRVYHAAPGSHRSTRVLIGEEQLAGLQEYSRQEPALTSVTRIRPGAERVSVGSKFYHSELKWVTETYFVDVPYSDTETYTETTSFGCPSGQLTCTRTATRTVTKHRTEWKTRTVSKWVDVTDDYCERFSVQLFERSHVYLLQYTYAGLGRCLITCLEQVAADNPEGSTFQPCPRPPGAAPRVAQP